MSIKTNIQLPEPAVLCMAEWDGPYQSIVCCVYQNLYHDPRHKVGVCHVSSIVTQLWYPHPDPSHLRCQLLCNRDRKLVSQRKHESSPLYSTYPMLEWGPVFYRLDTSSWRLWGDGRIRPHRRQGIDWRHLNVRRRIMSSDKWHVFVVTTETFACDRMYTFRDRGSGQWWRWARGTAGRRLGCPPPGWRSTCGNCR